MEKSTKNQWRTKLIGVLPGGSIFIPAAAIVFCVVISLSLGFLFTGDSGVDAAGKINKAFDDIVERIKVISLDLRKVNEDSAMRASGLASLTTLKDIVSVSQQSMQKTAHDQIAATARGIDKSAQAYDALQGKLAADTQASWKEAQEAIISAAREYTAAAEGKKDQAAFMARIEQAVQGAESTITAGVEQLNENRDNFLKDIDDSLQKSLPVLDQAMQTALNKEQADAADKLRKSIKASSAIANAQKSFIQSEARAITKIEQLRNPHVKAVSHNARRSSRILLIILIFNNVVLAICIVALFYMRRGREAVEDTSITDALQVMSRGDLTCAVDSDNKTGKSHLAEMFNSFLAQIRGMIGNIFTNTDKVTAASQGFSNTSQEISSSIAQITNAIQDVSRGAVMQLNNIQDVERSFDALMSDLKVMNENARLAGASSVQSVEHAQKGQENTRVLGDTIISIGESSRQSLNAIKKLKESFTEINSIVTMITSFADQTNLLSLNATIEAARAGEAGRGFSVVAEEVRKLAEGSADAGNRISKLVSNIIKEMDATANSVNSMAKQVDGAKDTVKMTGKFQGDIVDVAGRAKELVLIISNVASHQMDAASNILSSLKQVAKTAEDNAASSQEISSSTQEMMALMQEMSMSAVELARVSTALRELVAQFKV